MKKNNNNSSEKRTNRLYIYISLSISIYCTYSIQSDRLTDFKFESDYFLKTRGKKGEIVRMNECIIVGTDSVVVVGAVVGD